MPKTSKKKKLQKNLDFQKVKLKLGKKKPVADNFTDTSFKSKSITLLSQNITDNNDLNVLEYSKKLFADLLTKSKHYSSVVRKDSVLGLLDLAKNHPVIIKSDLEKLINVTCKNIIDNEHEVRRINLDLIKKLYEIFEKNEISVFVDLHVAFAVTGMSHIQDDIREDSLKIMTILVENAPEIVRSHGNKIIPVYYSLIQASSGKKTENEKVGSVKTMIISQTTRHEILFSLSQFLNAYFELDNSDKNITDDNVENGEIQLIQSFVYNHIPNSQFSSYLGGDGNVDFGLFKETSTQNIANVYTNTSNKIETWSNTSLFEDEGVRRGVEMLVNIFPFLEATWMETASSIFNVGRNFDSIKSKTKNKAKFDAIEMKLVAVVLKIICCIWKSINDGEFMNELFEFGYSNQKKQSLKNELKELISYQQFSFFRNLMVYFPIVPSLRGLVQEDPETNDLVLSINLTIVELVSIIGKSMTKALKTYDLLDSNMNLRNKEETNHVIVSAVYDVKVHSARTMEYLASIMGVQIPSSDKNTVQKSVKRIDFSKDQLKVILNSISRFVYYPIDVNTGRSAVDVLIKYSSDFRLSETFNVSMLRFILGVIKNWIYMKVSNSRKTDGSKKHILMDSMQLQSWVSNLPKVLWLLRIKNLEASMIILDILGLVSRNIEILFEDCSDFIKSLQLTLVPLFHVTLAQNLRK
ncbi:hypothetical protein BB558_000972 [Smittium angustum]|uniref:Pre-rRNA-processing protein n=1 Tax=Smittium angustum TaxID=133377 RepID=A0A2U1JD38_SMIAN|nr:hypothetical protein BB558_000972 [Smittium angustum]